MRRIFLLCFSLLVLLNLKAQEWFWAKGAGGSGMERAWDMAVDENGNIFTVGQFSDTMSVESYTFVSQGISDIFIAKYQSTGKLDWVKTFGGEAEDIALGVDVDSMGNSYFSGYFTDTMIVATDTLVAIGWDCFIIKLDTEGNLDWVRHPSGNGSEIGYGLAASPEGNVYVTGWFQDTMYFSESISTPSYGGSDIYVAKYNTEGNILWAKHAGTEAIDYGYKIDLDANENCYITGVGGTGGLFDTLILQHGGMLLAKYNASGEALAVNSASGNIGSNNISVADNGTGFIAGRVTNAAMFHGLGDSLLTFENTDDAYLAQFDSDCEWQWVVHAYGAGSDKARGVFADNNGNAFYTGSFNDVFTLGDTTLTPQGEDVFVAKVSSGGSYEWIVHGGGENTDIPTDIVVSHEDQCAITGWYTGESYMGSYPLHAANSGDMNFFVAAIGESQGIHEKDKSHISTNVYPNPVVGVSRIHVDSPKQCDESVLLVIYDELGREQKRVAYSKEDVESIYISAKDFETGIYFYTISSIERKLEGKFVVLR